MCVSPDLPNPYLIRLTCMWCMPNGKQRACVIYIVLWVWNGKSKAFRRICYGTGKEPNGGRSFLLSDSAICDGSISKGPLTYPCNVCVQSTFDPFPSRPRSRGSPPLGRSSGSIWKDETLIKTRKKPLSSKTSIHTLSVIFHNRIIV